MKIPKARRLSSGKWFVQLRLGGVSVPVTAATEKECIRQAGLAKAEYLAGKRQPKRPTSVDEPTLGKVVEAYIDSRKATRSPATIRGYNTLKNFHFKLIIDRKISEITKDDWQDACDAEIGKYSGKTIKNAWGLFGSAVEWKTGKRPPKISLPAVVPNEHEFLDTDQILVFVDAVRGLPIEIPALIALSSLRRSEILNLRWEDIDLKKDIIRVKGASVYDWNNKLVSKKENKNASSTRYVPILIPELHDALASAQKKEGYVVTFSPNSIWSKINEVCVANDLPAVGVHGLRHSFASLAYSLELPILTTMKIGGWSDPATVHKIYTHVAKKDLAKQAKKIAAFYRREGENANKNANKAENSCSTTA